MQPAIADSPSHAHASLYASFDVLASPSSAKGRSLNALGVFRHRSWATWIPWYTKPLSGHLVRWDPPSPNVVSKLVKSNSGFGNASHLMAVWRPTEFQSTSGCRLCRCSFGRSRCPANETNCEECASTKKLAPLNAQSPRSACATSRLNDNCCLGQAENLQSPPLPQIRRTCDRDVSMVIIWV